MELIGLKVLVLVLVVVLSIVLVKMSHKAQALTERVNEPFDIKKVLGLIGNLDSQFGSSKVDRDSRTMGVYLAATLKAVLGVNFNVEGSGNKELAKLKEELENIVSSLDAYMAGNIANIKTLLFKINAIKDEMVERQRIDKGMTEKVKIEISEIVRALTILNQTVKVDLELPELTVQENIEVSLNVTEKE